MDRQSTTVGASDGAPSPSILYLTASNQGPNGGAGHRMAAQLAALSSFGSVEMCVVTDEAPRRYGPDQPVHKVEAPRTLWIGRQVSRMLVVLGVAPANVDFVRVLTVRRRLGRDVKTRPDLIWCFGLPTIFMVPRKMRESARVFLDLCDFDAPRDLDLANSGASGLRRVRDWYFRRNVVAERRLARIATRLTEQTFISSELDRKALGVDGVKVIPNCVQPFSGPTVPSRSASTPTFLFVGTLDYTPNRDAVQWLIEEIWPSIREKVPHARVQIIGRGWSGPVPEPGTGVEVLGPVGDLYPHYRNALAALVPLRFGSGTRIKIVEAWANHLPVITTTKGAEGLATPGDGTALFADTVDDFVTCVTGLVRDPDVAKCLVESGQRRWSDGYSTARMATEVERAILPGDQMGVPQEYRWQRGR